MEILKKWNTILKNRILIIFVTLNSKPHHTLYAICMKSKSKYIEIGISAAVVICCIIAILLSGCKTQTIVVEKVQHDSIFIQNIRQDSIYLHDSIYVDRSKDTVLITKWHTDYRYKFVHDTTSIVRVDSIPYEVEIVKEVHKPNGWDRFCHCATISLLVALLLFVAYKLFKLYFRR